MNNPVVKAYLFPNGMVMAFDAAGQQVVKYQGNKLVAMPMLKADYPDLVVEGAVFRRDGEIEATPQPKLTAEQLIAIVDEASADYEKVFVDGYTSAVRKSLTAFKRALDEGMDLDLARTAYVRFCIKVDGTHIRAEAVLEEIEKELGLA